jgi:hypothetical protein
MPYELKPLPARCTSAEYEKMTLIERQSYARSFLPEARQIKPYVEMSPAERLAIQHTQTDAFFAREQEFFEARKKNPYATRGNPNATPAQTEG